MQNLVWFASDQNGGALLSQLYFADRSNDEGHDIFPSIARVASMTRQSHRTVQRQIGRFISDGWLVPETDRKGGGRPGVVRKGQPTRYSINPVWIEAARAAFSSADKSTHSVKLSPSDVKAFGLANARRVTSGTPEGDIRIAGGCHSYVTRTINNRPYKKTRGKINQDSPICEGCGHRQWTRRQGTGPKLCSQCADALEDAA